MSKNQLLGLISDSSIGMLISNFSFYEKYYRIQNNLRGSVSMAAKSLA